LVEKQITKITTAQSSWKAHELSSWIDINNFLKGKASKKEKCAFLFAEICVFVIAESCALLIAKICALLFTDYMSVYRKGANGSLWA
jgi:hypothetical protein